MAHKDWKGPGFYRVFCDGKWVKSSQREHNDFTDFCRYEKLENFEPPKPQEKLPDGLYAVARDYGGVHVIEFKDGESIRCKMDESDTILGRIPVEPI